jgi:hypothetical protein
LGIKNQYPPLDGAIVLYWKKSGWKWAMAALSWALEFWGVAFVCSAFWEAGSPPKKVQFGQEWMVI